MSNISKHIGERIKLYRKNKKMTQQDLADLIHKSKSVISKYECGDISVDIDTLFEISEILEVKPQQLIDMPDRITQTQNSYDGFFSAPSRLYLYFLKEGLTNVSKGVLELNYSALSNSTTSILFFDLEEYDNLYNCRHLYYGDIHYSDSYVNLSFKNQANQAERIFLIAANPFSNNASSSTGMICGISEKSMTPISFKVILSKVPLTIDEQLKSSLVLTKEEINQIKKNNAFTVNRLI